MELLQSLHLEAKNSGASTGPHWWSHAKEAGEIISYNPTNGEAIASIYNASEKDYDHVIKEAQKAFLSWREVPAPKRGEVIRAIGDELRKYKDFLGSLVSLEMGKSKQEGDGEVQEMIDMADLAVGQSRMLYGKTMHSERPHHRMYEQWHPLGVVSVISAFNFPVAVWSWNAFVAAICGNTVVWKPSPKTALCAVAVQHICNRVLDKFGYSGIFSLLVSDKNEIVTHMAKDERIPLVSFTGSTTVGRAIYTTVAERMGKVLLELSGNNAIIVDESANLELAVPAIVFGAVGTAGQRCTTTRRLFIHESLYDKLVNALVNAYKKVTIGDPLDQKNLMGPLIDQHAVDQYVKAIADAKQQGGKILFGGNAIKREGFFVEPTLIEAQNEWDVVQRETFGPILYVMKFKKLDDVIAQHNHSRFGLSSAMFTQNLQHAEAFLSARGSDCGIANINIGTSGAEIGGAFGGEKDTGGGREAGSDAWKAYMRRQTNTINWSKALPLAQGIKFVI
ncbi:L-piperidine-6-carboxylate dehydrogenase [Aquicella lusitana]|uniref:aldehyde dehydrogenase (NAD(+)) n=1 Tax=Aquicella lusitana TaxID=254246 RepID=A0A370GCM6_9COXI|nr:aldehyde dehydrogenase family protein [Aquicella lusitana]RDI40204.1 aldehyde dehydrogenase (NAD+) [Aquicella lusitana]VVC72405.1 Succinate-semialdehyde dehydrogenase [NADP(+)] GabD [Aquicella lusitana]